MKKSDTELILIYVDFLVLNCMLGDNIYKKYLGSNEIGNISLLWIKKQYTELGDEQIGFS